MHRAFGSRLSGRVFLLVPLLALSAVVYGCSEAQSGGSSDQGTPTIEETSETTTNTEETTDADQNDAPVDEAEQADDSQNSGGGGDGGDGIIRGEDGEDNNSVIVPDTREVELRLGGDEGVRFGGFCAVSGERERLSGRVPESFVYETDGEPVECVIRKRGGEGTLEVVMQAGNSSSVQQTDASGGEIRIGISGTGAASSTSSSSSSSSQSSSSVSVTRGDDSSGED